MNVMQRMRQVKMTEEKHWIEKQREDAEKVFAPKIHYDKENDILGIWWFPGHKYSYSIETESGFVFDISEEPDEDIKGVEIFDFMKKLEDSKSKDKEEQNE